MMCSRSRGVGVLAGSRTYAVTAWPASRACDTICLPVPPVAPSTRSFTRAHYNARQLNRLHVAVAAAAMVAALSMSPSAQGTTYRARLSMVPIDVAMQATVAGTGAVTATLKNTTLTINGTFTGLRTAATVARLHRSAKTGMRGAPIADLTVTSETSGTITGSVELTKEQVADLGAGRLYIQLHSQKAPDGNLWGWLLAAEKK